MWVSAESMLPAAGQVTELVLVKNTFLDVASEQRERRGSSSVPPSLRLLGSGDRRKSAPSSPSIATKAPFSDASSDASGDVKSTESGGSVAAESPTADELSEAEIASVSSEQRGSEDCWVQGGACTMACTMLNPRARAWTPCEMMACEPIHVQTQVGAIAEQVQAALATTGGILRAQVYQLPMGGWSVTAEVLPHQLQYKERLLKSAKEAMLAAAEMSSSIYVLGYKWRPFPANALGFSATLCDVQDEKACCWGYLETGACRFEGRCRWQHPMYQTTMSVAVLTAEY